MLNDLWAYWVVGYAAFFVGIGTRRLLNSKLLRERPTWDGDVDGLELATEAEIEAARNSPGLSDTRQI